VLTWARRLSSFSPVSSMFNFVAHVINARSLTLRRQREKHACKLAGKPGQ
jgi:hypothetical protein